MARCYPEEPRWAEDRRAERVVWEALRDALPDEAVLFHSVNLLEGGREHEVDLLVAWPEVGLATIEVKGGHVTRDAAGWHQESHGQRRPIGDPVLQVQDGKHVLLRYLEQRTSSAARARTAHLVALPFTDVAPDWHAPDLPRAALLDRHDLDDVAGRVREAVERHGAGHRPLQPVEADAVVAALAGQMTSHSSLLAEAEEHEARVAQMTQEQVATLAVLRYQRRMRVIGGAGTGKTWIALEQARRLAKDGQRVALVCYSRGLARWLQRQAQTWNRKEQPAFVGLFHDLPVRWGARPGTDDSDDFEVRLPRELGELARQQPASELFDAVVVDEAQDFGAQWWLSLLACLRDPERGGLFVFMDEAQRVFSRQPDIPIDLPDPIVLDNCIRTTKRIAQLFSSLSDEPLSPRGLEGPRVRLVEAVAEDVLPRADDAVDALLEEWAPGQVALLTTGHRHPEQRNVVERGGHDAYWDAFFDEDDVFYGHVLGFKGLERPVVVLAVNGFRDEQRAKEALYVGLSRARTLLVVVGERTLLERVGGGGVRERLKAAEAWAPA